MKRLSDIAAIRISDPLGAMWIWSLPCVLLLVLAWAGLAAGHPHLIGPDFLSFWTGAKMALQGKMAALYSIDGFQQEVRRAFPDDDYARVFCYPPHILLLIFSFGLFPYGLALALWSIAGAGCLIASLRANPFVKLRAPALALVALSPAALFSLIIGQNGAFTAALFLGGFYLSESAPVTAGVLFGLLTVKPQLGILVPFVLLLRRNWTCMISAAATAGLLVAATFLLWGDTPWRNYAAIILPFQASLVNPAGIHATVNSFNALMPGPYADFATLPGLKFPWLPYAAAALVAAVLCLMAVRRDGVSARSVAMIALATLVISPYGFNYDMTMIMGALAIYLATLKKIALPAHLAFGLLWVLPAALFMLHQIPFPFSTAIMLGTLACLHFAPHRPE